MTIVVGGRQMNKKMGIVLATVLAVIILGAVIYKTSDISSATEQETVDTATQNICTLPGNVVRMDIKDEDMTVRLERRGQEWINLDYEEITYDWLTLHAWLIDFRGIVSEGILEQAEGEDLYNINEDSDIITLYDEMNNAQTFKISDIDSENDSIYVSTDEIEGVYKISQEDRHILEKNINDFVVSKDIIPLVDEIKNIQIQSKEGKTLILNKEDVPNKSEWSLSEYYSIDYKADADKVAELLEQILSLNDSRFEGFITENNDYGISESSIKLIVNDNNIIRFGEISEGKLYINLQGEDFVYSIKHDLESNINKLDAFELIDKQILEVTTSNFKEIIFENPKGKYTLKSQKDVDQQLQNDSILETDKYTLYLNEKQLNEEDKLELIKLVNESISLEVVLKHPEIEQKEHRPEEASIICRMQDGEEIKLELVPYDINYYLLRMEDTIEFAINKDKVTTLFNKFNNIIKN